MDAPKPPQWPLQLKVQVWIYRLAGGLKTFPKSLGLEVLLLQTRPERGEFWQPVTGGVEPGESVEQAALREANEETGLELPAEGALERLGEFSFDSRWGTRVQETCYGLKARPSEGQVTPPIRLDLREHQAYRWVTAADARGMLRYPSNLSMLDALETLLRARAQDTES